MSEDTVDMQAEIEQETARLRDFARDYFANVRTKPETFGLLRFCMQEISDVIAAVAQRGDLTVDEVGRYQYCSCAAAAIIMTIEGSPLFDTEALPDQLVHSMDQVLKLHAKPQAFTVKSSGGGQQ